MIADAVVMGWEVAAETDTPDSGDGGGDGEGSVRRRLTVAAAFQRRERC